MISIVYQICVGLNYIHSFDIAHNDIKLENVFLSSVSNSNEVIAKIGDFGLSKGFDPNESFVEQ